MKKALALVLVLCMVVALCACGSQSVSSSTPATPSASEQAQSSPTAVSEANSPEEKPFHLGYLAAGMSSEFNMMIYDGLSSRCEAAGVELDTLSCEGDIALQIEQIDNFITMGVDCILAFPVDAGSCRDALIKAREAGIKVVTTDLGVGEGAYDLAYNYSEEALGKACAQAAADWIDATFPDAEPGSVDVAIIGANFSEASLARGNYQAAVAEMTDKANLVGTYNVGLENYATLTEQYTQVVLQNYPNIACIITFTDTMALIADEIIKQANVDMSKIGQFTIDLSKNGFDAIEASKTNESTIRGTAGFPDVCEHLFNMVMGNIEVDENGICWLDPVTVTADNIDDYLYLYY